MAPVQDNVATVTQSRNLDDVNPATHDNGSNTSDVTTSAGAAKVSLSSIRTSFCMYSHLFCIQGPNPDERVGWGSSQVSAQDKFFGAQASALGDPKSIQHPYEHSQHNLGTIKVCLRFHSIVVRTLTSLVYRAVTPMKARATRITQSKTVSLEAAKFLLKEMPLIHSPLLQTRSNVEAASKATSPQEVS